jgi:hypothetical protein
VFVKTRPRMINDTSSNAFEKISLNFYRTLNTMTEGYKYILTIQDCLTKCCILFPDKHGNAEEVVKKLTEKMKCYFGPPAAFLIDQRIHFQNKLLDEFAKLFCILPSIKQQHRTNTLHANRIPILHKFVFDQNPRTLTNLPNKNLYTRYGECIIKFTENLDHVQIIVFLNIIPAKYRSKFDYNK